MMLRDYYSAHNLSKRNYRTIITNTTFLKIPCKTINTTSLLLSTVEYTYQGRYDNSVLQSIYNYPEGIL